MTTSTHQRIEVEVESAEVIFEMIDEAIITLEQSQHLLEIYPKVPVSLNDPAATEQAESWYLFFTTCDAQITDIARGIRAVRSCSIQ